MPAGHTEQRADPVQEDAEDALIDDDDNGLEESPQKTLLTAMAKRLQVELSSRGAMTENWLLAHLRHNEFWVRKAHIQEVCMPCLSSYRIDPATALSCRCPLTPACIIADLRQTRRVQSRAARLLTRGGLSLTLTLTLSLILTLTLTSSVPTRLTLTLTRLIFTLSLALTPP